MNRLALIKERHEVLMSEGIINEDLSDDEKAILAAEIAEDEVDEDIFEDLNEEEAMIVLSFLQSEPMSELDKPTLSCYEAPSDKRSAEDLDLLWVEEMAMRFGLNPSEMIYREDGSPRLAGEVMNMITQIERRGYKDPQPWNEQRSDPDFILAKSQSYREAPRDEVAYALAT